MSAVGVEPEEAEPVGSDVTLSLSRIGLQSSRLDAGDRADLVIVGGVAGDADRAEQGAVFSPTITQAYGPYVCLGVLTQLSVELAGERDPVSEADLPDGRSEQ
jgi:hypothetical protein